MDTKELPYFPRACGFSCFKLYTHLEVHIKLDTRRNTTKYQKKMKKYEGVAARHVEQLSHNATKYGEKERLMVVMGWGPH